MQEYAIVAVALLLLSIPLLIVTGLADRIVAKIISKKHHHCNHPIRELYKTHGKHVPLAVTAQPEIIGRVIRCCECNKEEEYIYRFGQY